MTDPIDFTLNEPDVLVGLIRRDNGGQILTAGQIRFGLPQVFVPMPTVQRNTQIIVDALEGSLYTGSRAFFYDRVDINAFTANHTVDLTFTITNETVVTDLLPALNQRLGVNIAYDSVINDPLPLLSLSDPITTFPIRIAPTSLVYLGELVVILKRS